MGAGSIGGSEESARARRVHLDQVSACGCAAAGEPGRESIGAPCACAGVERVVRRGHRVAAVDVVKVGLFVAVLAALIFALWR